MLCSIQLTDFFLSKSKEKLVKGTYSKGSSLLKMLAGAYGILNWSPNWSTSKDPINSQEGLGSDKYVLQGLDKFTK